MKVRHPSGRRLTAFFDEELGRRRDARIARHVDRCDRCCETLASFGRVGLAIRGLEAISRRSADAAAAGPLMPPASRAGRAVRGALLAAALVAGILLMAGQRPAHVLGVDLIRPAVRPLPAPRAPGKPPESSAPTPSHAGLPVPATADPAPAPPNGTAPAHGSAPTTAATQAPAPSAPEAQTADDGSTAQPAAGTAAAAGASAPPATGPPDAGPAADASASTPQPTVAAAPAPPAGPLAIGVIRPASGRQERAAAEAAGAFIESVDQSVVTIVSDDPVAAIGDLSSHGVKVVVIPVWPETASVADIDKAATEAGMVVLSGGVSGGRSVVSLRPPTVAEATATADGVVAAKPNAVALFVGDRPDDRVFAASLYRALNLAGVKVTYLPDQLCATRLAVPDLDVAVVAAGSADTEACLAAAPPSVHMIARVTALEGITTGAPAAGFVSPLAVRGSASSIRGEARAVVGWAAGLVGGAGGDPAAVRAVRRPAGATAAEIDLSQPNAVASGYLIAGPPVAPTPSPTTVAGGGTPAGPSGAEFLPSP